MYQYIESLIHDLVNDLTGVAPNYMLSEDYSIVTYLEAMFESPQNLLAGALNWLVIIGLIVAGIALFKWAFTFVLLKTQRKTSV